MAQKMAQAGSADIDLFTIEIVKDALVAIGDEMFIALQRTSKSTIIYEVLDFASGLTDAKGQLITQGNGVTGFLGTLTFAVRSTLEKFGAENLHPGDVVITNDPYGGGGTHLSDVSLIVPIFYENQLVAFAASKAHWTEVGGKDPGSWTTDSIEVFQEGLQFPCVKLYEEGRPVQSLIDLIAANVRLPDMTLGDMYAQAASLHLGERRFQELCAKYGLDVVQSSIEALLDYGERMTLLELAKLPKGVYEAEDWIDDDGIGNGPFPVRVKITITDSEFICDFTGTHPQVPGPVNCALTGLHSGVRTMLKAITSPTIPVNEGCFRPLKVICPPGTIFTAERPAAVSTYWETMNYVTDLVWKALAPIVPDRLSAGHFLSVCGIVLAGIHPDTNELFLLVEPQAGGWGAGAAKDGESGLMCVGDGETYVIPVEIAETRYGILVDRYELDTAPHAGAGRHRGGRGCIRDYRAVADNVTLTATFGRHKYVPWGVNGGQEGSRNEVRFFHADGREVVVGKCARYPLKRGEVARLITATGGGWGSPLERPVEEVIEDVRDGYVSLEQAKRDYGVELDPQTFAVIQLSEERSARS
ncbi:MAG TPA: hydantoinase B/oxoprolinase family protein [Ktedonobacteraceae bacterium]|nr:hydantoinase B/oxoprolinase family protein [Ktedonobacteraceae bacterium]